MNDKTKAILEITAPNGQEFVDKGAIVNQTKGLNGVCVKLYIPTKAIQKPIDTDSLQDLIAQAEADKEAYPLTWWTGYEYHSKPEGWNIFKKEPSHDIKFFNFRRRPQANIIMQSEQDRIDYPEFWCDLVQWKNSDNEWRGFGKNWIQARFGCEFEYRQHPHRKNIIKFHACSEEDKKRWECCNTDIYGLEITKWYSAENPSWCDNCKYRMRPRICFVTLQDGTRMEWDEPARDALNAGKEYFVINTHKGGVSKCIWNDMEFSNMWLKNGLIHLTEEAAKQHLAAIQAMNVQVAI